MEQSIFLHLEIAYTVSDMESSVYMFSIFSQIRIMHTAYMESQLKTTHHLFKWCHQLNFLSTCHGENWILKKILAVKYHKWEI